MDATRDSFAQFVGRIVFPRNLAELRSHTQCPACLSPLRSPVCSVCGLDLTSPLAVELAAASARAADALDDRVELIGRIRFESAEAVRAATGVTLVPNWEASVGPSPQPPVQPPVGPPAPPAKAREPRRSSVQVILLIVGVALLSIAAIFFLVYAFITYGILVRSVIIAAVTVAAFVVASLLRRRNLGGTAEGIAVFAAVLVFLDAFAIRANDLFSAAHSDLRLYWGVALLVASIGLIVWRRASGLRVPSVIGFAAFAPGVGLIVGGIGTRLDPGTRDWLVFAVIAAAGLVNVLAPRWVAIAGRKSIGAPERAIVLGTASVALIVALVTSFWVAPQVKFAPAISLGVVALIAFAHQVASVRWKLVGGSSRVAAAIVNVIAIVGVVAATLVGVGATVRNPDELAFVYLPVLFAVPVVVIIETFAKRIPDPVVRRSARAAFAVGSVIAFFALCASIFLPAARVVITAGGGVASGWSHSPLDDLGGFTRQGLDGTLAFAGVLALTAVVWLIAGIARQRIATVGLGVAILVIGAVPLLDTALGVTLGWSGFGLLAAAAYLALRRSREGRGRRALRAVIIGASAVSTIVGYLASWVSIATWAIGTIALLVVLLAFRTTVEKTLPAVRGLLLLPATLVLLIGVAALSRQISGNHYTAIPLTVDTGHAIGVAATILFLLAIAVPWGHPVDRRFVFWTALPVAIGAGLASQRLVAEHYPTLGNLFYAEPIASVVVSAAFLLALALVLTSRPGLEIRVERIVVSALVAPAVLWFLDSVLRTTAAPELIHSLVPIGSGLLVAGIALAAGVTRSDRWTHPAPRWAAEIGVAVVVIPTLVIVLLVHPTWTWLALVLSGVTALLVAIAPDGLFGSRSPRRYLGWLSLALGAVGLWWRLGSDRASAVELYVLPLAGALLGIALLIWRATRTRDGGESQSAPLLALAGLLVGILPVALASSSGTPTRAILVGSASLVLLAVGTALPRSIRVRQNVSPYLDAAAFAGALGAAVVGVGRAVAALSTTSIDAPVADAWIAATFFVVLAAGAGYARATGESSDRLRSNAAQVAFVAVSAAATYIELHGFGSASLGPARAIGTIALFSLVYLIALWSPRAPLTPFDGWFSIGWAGILAVSAIVERTTRPIELVTVPIALALLAVGSIRLGESPSARSWPRLGPGILVLLGPSLIATILDRPVWRLVAIGVIAIGFIVIGAIFRLQSPFVLGVVFVLVHAIATFEAQIRAVYQAFPWWLWLGVGGVILIVLAARYEQRIRNLRSAAMRVAALR